MTTQSLFDALEICLQALDQGADVESCLVRYPDLADELRPVLTAAVQARTLAITEVPAEVVQRSKARVLQAAAEMREEQYTAPALPFWRKKGFFGARFYRLALTTALVIAFLLTGGTGLVNASNGAVPGDRLYPVKRSWEGIQLIFVLDQQAKTELEHKFDHERVQEIEVLYSEKRFEQVNFEGVVETQQTGFWRISGLDVAVENETVYSGEIVIGSTVQVVGETDDGIIKAEQITLIATPGSTPTAISTSTPRLVPQILQTNTPEVGEDSGSSGSSEVESPQPSDPSEKSGSESETGSNLIATPHPNREDSGSTDGGGTSSKNSQPSTEESGGGDD
jgi:hypothetical protein